MCEIETPIRESDLLPCPFCGDKAEYDYEDSALAMHHCDYYWLGCSDPQCIGFHIAGCGRRETVMCHNARQWNMRPREGGES